MMHFPNIDPIAFHLLGWPVRWYGISYFIAFMLTWYLIRRYSDLFKQNIEKEHFDHLLTYCIVGIVVGGRLGHMVFYDFHSMIQNPLSILKTWEGGMAFHGGLIGCFLGATLYLRKNKLPLLVVMDLMALVAPLGIFCVRIANFINAELYGRITTLPWGVIFPGQEFPRHPSQLYEAMLEGLLLFVLMRLCARRSFEVKAYGNLTGLFLIGYGFARFMVEYVREPSDGVFSLLDLTLTYGQLLTLPMIVLGAIILRIKSK